VVITIPVVIKSPTSTQTFILVPITVPTPTNSQTPVTTHAPLVEAAIGGSTVGVSLGQSLLETRSVSVKPQLSVGGPTRAEAYASRWRDRLDPYAPLIESLETPQGIPVRAEKPPIQFRKTVPAVDPVAVIDDFTPVAPPSTAAEDMADERSTPLRSGVMAAIAMALWGTWERRSAKSDRSDRKRSGPTVEPM
jgi:hypothetical protein